MKVIVLPLFGDVNGVLMGTLMICGYWILALVAIVLFSFLFETIKLKVYRWRLKRRNKKREQKQRRNQSEFLGEGSPKKSSSPSFEGEENGVEKS